MAARKHQMTVYLEGATLTALESLAKKTGRPKSLVAETAILSFLTGDDADRREAAITKRLDRIIRLHERHERNDTITFETLAYFIRVWMTATPVERENTTASARVKGKERFERFVETIAGRLANGISVLKEVVDDLQAPAAVPPAD